MQSREIKRHLKGVVDDWVASLEDGPRHRVGTAADLKVKVEAHGVIIAGGAVVSLLMDEEPNDYDFFFPTLEFRNEVFEYYAKCYPAEATKTVYTRTNQRGEITLSAEQHPRTYVINEEGRPNSYDPKIITRNAITLNNKVQLVTCKYGVRSHILNSFDFDHTRVAYTYPGNELYSEKDALESILTKELRYGESLYPIAALIRAHKFVQRGFVFPLPELLKIAFQINALDLTDKEVILDQLTGVSANVALNFVRKLTEREDETGLDLLNKDTHKDNFEVLCELIDDYFNDPANAEIDLAWNGV